MLSYLIEVLKDIKSVLLYNFLSTRCLPSTFYYPSTVRSAEGIIKKTTKKLSYNNVYCCKNTFLGSHVLEFSLNLIHGLSHVIPIVFVV